MNFINFMNFLLYITKNQYYKPKPEQNNDQNEIKWGRGNLYRFKCGHFERLFHSIKLST